MRKIILVFVVFASSLFADEELLLNSANAFIKSARANSSVEISRFVEKSKAILIFPKFHKGGLVIGAAHGSGIMIIKDQVGFEILNAKISSASLGLQAGYESSYLVFFVLKDSVVSDIKDSKFTMGARAVMLLGNNDTRADYSFNEDIYGLSNNSGIFVGASLNGALISADNTENYHNDTYAYRNLIDTIFGY